VSDGTSETTYVAMQPQEGHVEETITSMDASDDVSYHLNIVFSHVILALT
jgi:hypothetical protein